MIDLNGARENLPVRIKKSRNFQDFIDGITLTAISALLIVVVMLYITRISFSAEFSLEQIGYEGVILYAATVSISLLARKYSRRKGKATAVYIKAFERVEDYNHIIINSGYSAKAREYCRRWEEEELHSSRMKVLAGIGISVKDFEEKYLRYSRRELVSRFPDLTEDEIKVICSAKRIKRLKYSEKYLTASDTVVGRHSPSSGYNTHIADKVNVLQTLVTGALSGLFSATLVVDVVANPSWGTIVACAVKLIIIVIFGVFNIIGGYNMSAVKETRELNAKADEQERFIRWCEEQKSQPVNQEADEKEQESVQKIKENAATEVVTADA